jgi:hypothetical protein
MKITKQQLRQIVKEAWLDEDPHLEKRAFLDAQADIWADALEAYELPGAQRQIRQSLEDLYNQLFDNIKGE